MPISLVAAIGQKNCIGKDNDLPWHIPEDMKRVKELTIGKVVIMGRKTWESIPEKYRPLPKRLNVVITRNTDYQVPEGVEVFHSLEDALKAHREDDIVGFGGQRVFADMMPLADTLHITHVEQTVEACGAFFPDIDMDTWEEAERKDFDGFYFSTYKRK